MQIYIIDHEKLIWIELKTKEEPFLIKIVLLILNLIDSLQNRLMKLPLYIYALSTALIFVALPLILVWSIYIIVFTYLPFYFRVIAIWGLFLGIVALCAAIDYVRAS